MQQEQIYFPAVDSFDELIQKLEERVELMTPDQRRELYQEIQQVSEHFSQRRQ